MSAVKQGRVVATWWEECRGSSVSAVKQGRVVATWREECRRQRVVPARLAYQDGHRWQLKVQGLRRQGAVLLSAEGAEGCAAACC